jgi:hypothetical protein
MKRPLGRFPAAARLAACPHNIGTARSTEACDPRPSQRGPRLSGLAAHDRAVHLGVARTAHALGGMACTLGGAVTSPTREGGRLCAQSGGARLRRRGGRGGGAYRRVG